jgi:hypothetical protein
MPKFCDLTSERFGRLVVMSHIGRTKAKKQLWECRCDCGATHKADSGSLVWGSVTSCGCYLKERITKHGGTGKASYNTWRAMMRRCYNSADKDYPKYGGRGVMVYSAWHTYTTFVAEMGEPIGRQTLDRIDPYGDYTPANCRWASPTIQARNIRALPNKSGHRGIYATENGKWMAAITAGGKKYYGKCHDVVEKAVADRKELEHLHWGASSGT